MDKREFKDNVYLDLEPILTIFAQLGPEEVAMYVLLQAMQQPVSFEQLSNWSHLPKERVIELCSRLGFLQLGITPPNSE